MSVASVSETEKLIRDFELYDARVHEEGEDSMCWHLATVNALIIAARNFDQGQLLKLPAIAAVKITEMNDTHAYLVYDGKVYNYRITFPTRKYPDLSTSELNERKALDYTGVLMADAIKALRGKKSKYHLEFVTDMANTFNLDSRVMYMAMIALATKDQWSK